jgi:hypothetical protein
MFSGHPSLDISKTPSSMDLDDSGEVLATVPVIFGFATGSCGIFRLLPFNSLNDCRRSNHFQPEEKEEEVTSP